MDGMTSAEVAATTRTLYANALMLDAVVIALIETHPEPAKLLRMIRAQISKRQSASELALIASGESAGFPEHIEAAGRRWIRVSEEILSP